MVQAVDVLGDERERRPGGDLLPDGGEGELREREVTRVGLGCEGSVGTGWSNVRCFSPR